MAGNRFPEIPKDLADMYGKFSKAELLETLYDLSELHADNEKARSAWVIEQIALRRMANKG